MEQPTQTRRLAMGRHPAVGIDPGIEQQPLADGAIGQLCGQAAIGPRQPGASQLSLEGDIGIRSGRHSLQHLPGEEP
jgi:hypothetical protein